MKAAVIVVAGRQQSVLKWFRRERAARCDAAVALHQIKTAVIRAVAADAAAADAD